ncbi:MAG TPA: SHOCT domain-containing protein [Stellaceae bacterium]
MQELTPEGRRMVEDLARRHDVSKDAVLTLLRALMAGNRVMAQFSHPELGGMGQWSKGGMIMVGDMFDHALKHRVDILCSEIADVLRDQNSLISTEAEPSQSQGRQGQSGGTPSNVGLSIRSSAPLSRDSWWPAELGAPSSVGAQNSLRYAFFPAARRVVIEQSGKATVYDTGDHRITGVSQQQAGDQSLTFTSQHGPVRIADLPVVADAVDISGSASKRGARESVQPPARSTEAMDSATSSTDDPFAKIERLAELRQKGILTEEEFAAKKAELLSRL